jgi:hypothetical protein
LRCPRDRMLVRSCTPPTRHALSAAAVWPPAGLPGAPLLENASWPATGQLSSAALNQPVRKATVYWMCLNALQLRGRLDQIYTIDLVEAPLSICVLPHLRLAQLVESPAAGDDPRRVRERTINSKLLLCSFHDTDNISSVCRTRPISRAASVLGGSRMRHRAPPARRFYGSLKRLQGAKSRF